MLTNLRSLLGARTLLAMGSTFALALAAITMMKSNFLLHLLYRGLYFGNTLFHEMGHAITSWLFGRPAIPSILTMLGGQDAAGMTLPFGHSWMVQIGVWLALAYGCYRLRRDRPALFWPVTLFVLLLIALSFTKAARVLPLYMGHGGAILAGAVMLYRAWLDIVVKTAFERWCNALFGFFILLQNAAFGYGLAYNPETRAWYSGGVHTNDFLLVSYQMPGWTVAGLGLFTCILSIAALIGSFLLAAFFFEDEHYDHAAY